MLTVIDKCGDIEEARNVVTELMEIGFNRSDIDLIINTPDDTSTVSDSLNYSMKSSEETSQSGFVNALKEMGVPEDDAFSFDNEVRQGKILVTVNTPEDKADLVVEIMGSHKLLSAEAGMEADLDDVRIYGNAADIAAQDEEDLTTLITLEEILLSIQEPMEDEFEISLVEDESELRPGEVDFIILSPQEVASTPMETELNPREIELNQVSGSDLQEAESKEERVIERNEQEVERVKAGGFYSQSGTDYSAVPDDLVKLENLTDYEVADGEPDPRGWDLIGRDDQKVGTIKNLLASPSNQMAYFAIIDCGDWLQDRLFIVPLSNINFDRDREKAFGPFAKEQFLNAPVYLEGDRDFSKHNTYWTTGGSGRGMAKSAGSSL
jgi:hypothetical protein